MTTPTIRNTIRSIALLSLLAAGTDGSAQPLFLDSTATHLPNGSMPQNGMDVEAADIDGDGDLDIIIANEFEPNVILINDGSGRFTNESAQRIPQPVHDSEDIAVADFDGDGDPDIVFVSEDDFVHEYYLNDGAGVFSDASDRLPMSEANAVAAADVTGDGFPDLFIGNAGQDFLLINDGKGNFVNETAQRLPAELNVTQDLEPVDLDGDGDLDLVIGNEDGNRILINDGTGRYTDRTTDRLPILADMETRKVSPVDIDGDGDLDLYFANVAWNPLKNGRDRIYINDGTGHFADRTQDLLPEENESTIDAKLADLDLDGDPDLLTVDFPNRPVKGFLNDGTGKMTEATGSILPGAIVVAGLGIEFADLNGDGIIDLYLCNRGQADRLLFHARPTSGAGGEGRGSLHQPELLPNEPNPFNGSTRIRYTIPRAGNVEVAVYTLTGELVDLVRRMEPTGGEHHIVWEPENPGPGAYLCRLTTEQGAKTRVINLAGPR